MIERLAIRVSAHIAEKTLSEIVKGHTTKITRRDDAVGINICAWNINCSAGNLSNRWNGHGLSLGLSLEKIELVSVHSKHLASIGNLTLDRSSGYHQWAHQHRAARWASLAAFKVSV